MKKMVSVLLCLCMLATAAVPVFAADQQGTAIPNIYLQGQGSGILNEEGRDVYAETHMPDGFLADAVKQCMPSFIEAVRKDDDASWAAYRETFMEVVMPVFGDYFLDKNGEPSNGTHIDMSWWNRPVDQYQDGSYKIRSYNFYQDWRLDPFVNADSLHNYILKVKSESGKDKVNLVGRCEGTNVIFAYLDKYGYDDVNCVELYVQSASGVDLINALFSGEMQFDATALRRFKRTNDLFTIEDQITNELVEAALEMTGDTMLLDAGLLGLQALEPKIYKELIVYVLRDTYGTMPGIWSLVGPEYYQTARKGVFEGYEEEFACLLEKLDYYDAHVRNRLEEILLDGMAAGVRFANYAKYGDFQVQPLCKTNNEIGDNSVSLKYASLGATTAKYGSTLSDSYIAKREKAGFGQYISPDKMIDASTCYPLRDTTWFIFGSEHRDFPDIIHDFMFRFLKADGNMTVFSDPEAPQFMLYEGEEDNGDTLKPMAKENAPTIESDNVVFKKINWKDMFLRFWNALKAFLKQFLASRSAA